MYIFDELCLRTFSTQRRILLQLSLFIQGLFGGALRTGERKEEESSFSVTPIPPFPGGKFAGKEGTGERREGGGTAHTHIIKPPQKQKKNRDIVIIIVITSGAACSTRCVRRQEQQDGIR